MDKTMDPWYSLSWFDPATLSGYTWQNPLFLFVLFSLPLVFILRWMIRYLFNQKLPVALVKSELRETPLTLLRFLPEFILAATVALILVALARPQKTNEKVEQWTEGIDIMLSLDISQSMQIEDFQPNRLEAAKQVARDFIKGRIQDRIGLVVFSGDPFSLAPLTTDYELLYSYLNDISFYIIESRSTAIGTAVAVVTNLMSESESKSHECILLTNCV